MEADMEPPQKHPHPLRKSVFLGLSIRRIYGGAFHTYHTYDETEGGYSSRKDKIEVRHCSNACGKGKSFRKNIEIF